MANSMKNAGKSKAAVLNSRSPKKPMAISGDTMNGGSMYKKGGTTKKYQVGGPKPAVKPAVKVVVKAPKAATDSTSYYADQTRKALNNMSPKNPGSEEAYDKAVDNQLGYENRKNKTNFKKPTPVPSQAPSGVRKKGGTIKSKTK